MRTRTPTERNLIKSALVNHHIFVEVQNEDRDYIDITEWLNSAEWGDSLDTPSGTFTLTFKRDITTPDEISLAPAWGGSPLNRNNAAAYAPLLHAGRNVRIWTAVTAAGVAPVEDDWKFAFIGRIDTVAWPSDPISVHGRDLAGWLVNTWIESEKAYATDGPNDLEDIMQEILTDWPVGFDEFTMFTPASPGVAYDNSVAKVKQGIKNVLEALQQDWALSIGWLCRMKYDSDTDTHRLTFYDIERERTDPTDSFGPTEYRDITDLEISDEYVRNRIQGQCFGPDGELITETVNNGDPDNPATSQGKYGIKFMSLKLALGDPIDSRAELIALLNKAKSDLGEPFATQTMETLYYWPVELGDLYTFLENASHYDDDQLLAVVGYTHRFANGEGVTTMQCRGNIVGSYHAWFRKGIGDNLTPEQASQALNNFKWTDSANGLERTFTMTAGANVHRVAVFNRLMEAPPLTDPWPILGTVPVAILTPDPVTRLVQYTVTKPSLLTQRFVQFEPRFADWTAGEVRRAVVDPSPTALDAAVHAEVTNITADLEVVVTGGVADWPVLVEFFEDDPTGVAFASTTLNASATLTKLTAGLAALGARTLPQREHRKWWVRLTNVADEEKWATATADRDSLAYGYATTNDFRSAPTISVDYDDDTDVVKFFIPGGKTKTFAGLSGSGTVSYTVGDAVDIGSVENALAIDETRVGYSVQVQGGGQWTTIFTGNLHGATTGPSLTVTPTPGATQYSIAYTGSGTITLSIDGGSYTTPAASPIIVARHATIDKTYSFKCVQANQTIIDTITVPSLEKDTITPDLTVTPGTPTSTTQPFTPTAANPATGAAVNITVTPYNCSMIIGGVTFSTPQTIASGTVVTALRNTSTTDTQAHIKFSATIAGAGTEEIDITLLAVLNVGPSLTITPTPGSPNYSIVWSGTGTITLSIDGAAYATPSASPISVARHATNDKTYTFKAVGDGQTIIDSVTIPSLEKDTVTPDINIAVGTPTSTQQPYTASCSNPSGGAAPTMTVTPTNCSMVIGGVTYTTQQTIASGTVVTVNRPATTEPNQAHIKFIATLSGGGIAEVSRTVPAQLNSGPSLILNTTPGATSYSISWSGTGTITVSIDGGSYNTPSASPIVVTRDAADQIYDFKAVADGQTIVGAVIIPAIPGSNSARAYGLHVTALSTALDTITLGWTNENIPSSASITLQFSQGGNTFGENAVHDITGLAYTDTSYVHDDAGGDGHGWNLGIGAPNDKIHYRLKVEYSGLTLYISDPITYPVNHA